MSETNDNNASKEYSGKSLTVLEGLEAVRKRPGMYIGTTSIEGLHHLVWEIVDNSIDEALAGYANHISIEMKPDNVISITDNGRGIPVDIVEKTGKSGVETVLTILHAGGKFGGENSGYKVAGGLHGVGATVVNALSSWLECTVYKEGREYFIRFESGGHVVAPLKDIGPTKLRGTKITFKPDPTIFTESTEFDYDVIKDHIKQMAFLNRGLKISLIDHRIEPLKEVTFYYEGGISEYVRDLNKNKGPLFTEVFYCEGDGVAIIPVMNETDGSMSTKEGRVEIEAAVQYNATSYESMYSFCNNIRTSEGGFHEDGFMMALTRELKNYAEEKKNFVLKEESNKNKRTYSYDPKEPFRQEDVKEGLVAIVSVRHPNPQYKGQTKNKLGNEEVRAIASQVIGPKLKDFLQENPDAASKICIKVLNAQRARIAADKAREAIRKGSIELTTLPGKLADCSSTDPVKCELFIVEGNSAGGSAKNARNREFQAILPLRGKILNVEKATQEKVFDNAEIGSIITAIGSGYGNIFDLEKARYHKVIIMTDADVDGSHISVLLLTLFYRFMKPLIEAGYIYIAQPPLYKVTYHQKDYYAYNDDQLLEIKKQLNLKDGYPTQRYKGLGEMDADQLKETTMDMDNRKLLQVTMERAEEADRVFTDLMGDEVDPRRDFIINNARFVKNLDT
ncbi:MAG: type IIA DNA topoisomerase subunit B [Erysipelotrichaceae bacterium]|jgi:DNA gyrase subunit B|nr:type IIA DNA topoisomerase subunit B [Erysipelotrichaceae bacterium]